MNRARFVVAVDGPAASGKSTLSARLAHAFELAYLDTGLLYRAVARQLLDADLPCDLEASAVEVARNLDPATLARDDLRTEAVSQGASQVGAIQAVRQALLNYQREFAQTRGGALLAGRDVGTVVCPDADKKLFVTADVETRARRRFDELRQRQPSLIFADVLADMRARDRRDTDRAASPLLRAPDAYVLDTSTLDPEAAFAAARAFVAS